MANKTFSYHHHHIIIILLPVREADGGEYEAVQIDFLHYARPCKTLHATIFSIASFCKESTELSRDKFL